MTISERDLVERLERERPFPSAAFRGNLRRTLYPPERSTEPSRRYRLLAPCYLGLGLLCFVTAAAGVVGVGPFTA